ncbi:phospholipase D-like domain-containing protein [Maribellus sediminis]|uniref:phospholipase D-like domain-containing protein n=1 Tax=Maribellus sediminis TaxID=2696285 RepID=UPI001431C910|nr:phospholipase D-like domain-containing protein [Maribellus sediminis]
MTRTLLVVILSLISFFSYAQNAIGDARQQTVGTVVTVSGIVTNGSELGTIRYMQDNTGGIAVYDNQLSGVNRGDSISVTGELDDYNNLLEIKNVTTITVHKSGLSLPSPKLITIDNIGENYESQLIAIDDISFADATGAFSGNKNYTFTNGSLSGDMRINTNSPIVGQPIPTEAFKLVALCSQFSYTNNNTQSGYQLLPRDMDDFVSKSEVNFTSQVKVISLDKNSVVLGWTTDNGAFPFVRYGNYNNADSLTNYKAGDSTTSDEVNSHIAEITGLQPSEVIYAQVFMVLESDTVFSGVHAYVTESNSTGDIKVYFNSEVDQDLATTTPAQNIGDSMADTLVAYINRAEESIDLSIYNFDNKTVSDALNAAAQRGVKIRVITCGSTSHASIYNLSNAIPVLERPEITGQQSGIMHNKFAIFDADHSNANKVWVWSGSTNLTAGQLYSDANNMIFIQDQSLAMTYKIEFEEMWGSSGDLPDALAARFGEDKTDNTPHELMIGGNWIESYFSPSDQTNQKLIDAMGTADYNLHVETMLITRSDLAAAITDAFQRGVNVNVITDVEASNVDYVNDALNNTLPDGKFVFDNTATGLLHHKLAIIDANSQTSDPQVITGSHNWSNSANDINDENTLIIHNADIANQYLQQFAYRFGQNNGDFVVSALLVENPELKVYPNPSEGQITVSSDQTIKSVQLFNLSGALLQQWEGALNTIITIELPAEISGMYLLKVEQDNGAVGIHKIVKH